MAKLVFGIERSLDGYVDHMALGPSLTLFPHFIELVGSLAVSGGNKVVNPDFIGKGAAARDQNAGILIEVGGTAELESVRIYVKDERHGATFSFHGVYLARDPNGNATSALGPDRRLCGYEGMGRVGTFAAQTQLSLEEISAYVIEGLRVIASNLLALPKDEVVIQVELAP